MMEFVRDVLSAVLLTGDKFFPASKPVISAEEKLRRQALLNGHVLYQFTGCPFCIKVRRGMRRLGVSLPLKNANEDEIAKKELIDGGKEYQVPCLRIQSDQGDQWMYESDAILQYLNVLIGCNSS